MKVYCVMERDYYGSRDAFDELCSVWFSKEQAEIAAKTLDEEFKPYEHYVREEEVR